MIVVTVAALIKRSGEYLFIEEQKEAAKGKVGLPGGKLEEKESVEEAVIREVREETGYHILSPKIVAVSQKPFTKEHNSVIKFIFSAEIDPSIVRAQAELPTRWLSKEDVQRYADKDMVRGQDIADIVLRTEKNSSRIKIDELCIKVYR